MLYSARITEDESVDDVHEMPESLNTRKKLEEILGL